MRKWLNRLSAQEAKALCKLMRMVMDASELQQISGGNPPGPLGCLPQNEPRTGEWYERWVTCYVVHSGSDPGTSHTRWAPKVVVPGTVLTPEAPKRTSSHWVARLMSQRLEPQKWLKLKQLSAPSNGTVKIPCHHLAFRAYYPDIPLPTTLGSGSSISHLCDTPGCARGAHLELANQHRDNLARQRCTGVTLVAVGDMIVQEVPCSHGSGNTTAELIKTSCRKIKMVWLSDAAVNHMVSQFQQMLDGLAMPLELSQ